MLLRSNQIKDGALDIYLLNKKTKIKIGEDTSVTNQGSFLGRYENFFKSSINFENEENIAFIKQLDLQTIVGEFEYTNEPVRDVIINLSLSNYQVKAIMLEFDCNNTNKFLKHKILHRYKFENKVNCISSSKMIRL